MNCILLIQFQLDVMLHNGIEIEVGDMEKWLLLLSQNESSVKSNQKILFTLILERIAISESFL